MEITRLRGESEVADDDGTVPNRTRHSVMRSPMSAEAIFSEGPTVEETVESGRLDRVYCESK